MKSQKEYNALSQDSSELASEIQAKLSKLRIKEIVSMLKTAKSMKNHLTFQEILSLDYFPLHFYSNTSNGFGLKPIIWGLNTCTIQEEYKLILTDPENMNKNDEWRYHDSFFLVLDLKSSLSRKQNLKLELKTKERLYINRDLYRYVWKVANLMLDEWFCKNGYDTLYKSYLQEKKLFIATKQVICFYKVNEKKMKEGDLEELIGFIGRLMFLIEKLAYLVRKPVGFTWVFQAFFNQDPNYAFINMERYLFLKERSVIRRYLACHLTINLGLFLCHYWGQKIIENQNPTEDIKLFYDNFEPWLKENTFAVLNNNRKKTQARWNRQILVKS